MVWGILIGFTGAYAFSGITMAIVMSLDILSQPWKDTAEE